MIVIIIGYMLEPDPDKRPNIFQVCHVVHHLRGYDNPVANVFVSVCVCVHVHVCVHACVRVLV